MSKSHLKPNKSTKALSLKDVVDALKKDLLDAHDAGKTYPLFSVEEASIEIMVNFDRTLQVGGGVLKVLPLPSAAEKTASGHKLTLKLKLLPPTRRGRLQLPDQNDGTFALGSGDSESEDLPRTPRKKKSKRS